MAAQVLVAAFDGTSRVPGVSLGAERLWQALSAELVAAPVEPVVVREESKSSALWCRKLKQLASDRPIRLTLGGEHLVSFPLLEVLAQRHPGLRVVVLDAHHDAYDYPLLTHYSVFHYVRHELELPTLILGARHELERMPAGCELFSASADEWLPQALRRVRDFVEGAPFYLSIDLDVLNPAEFGAVSDPRPGGLSLRELAELTRELLALAPVGADIVEYNPLLDPDRQGMKALQPFLAEVGRWLA